MAYATYAAITGGVLQTVPKCPGLYLPGSAVAPGGSGSGTTADGTPST